MAKDMILPALGMAQSTGKVVRWLKPSGEWVQMGDSVVEIETDKATVELEAPAAGILVQRITVSDEDIPVGHVIAQIMTIDEASQQEVGGSVVKSGAANAVVDNTDHHSATPATPAPNLADSSQVATFTHAISPLAARMAAEHHLDLRLIQPGGRRIEKTDVLAYLQQATASKTQPQQESPRLLAASPKARRLAREQGISLATLTGSGPDQAVLAADIATHMAIQQSVPAAATSTMTPTASNQHNGQSDNAASTLSTIWRIMAERTTQSWTSVPHFFLMREINASRIIAWREQLLKRTQEKCTYTDLLVKLVAAALKEHPRINASWRDKSIHYNADINIGIAVAINDGLVVPVIQHTDQLSVEEIAQQRTALVAQAQAGKLRPQDMQHGTFTISNLGMYGIDGFTAIINPPQAAILAVSRISDRVIAVNGQPMVQPMMTCSLSCDHRVIDGARGAQFLATLADLIEEPLSLLH
ncbi:dihydrolipoamide acetyltransferase family protein [Dictyobacter formicarum]|uniref:Dihydrolipoamide acetyltransferase component of pyruvate dehydrogenase complex n=1 Tax=Dictyobacter formicarum TaxID=2778368 RepID=A0ABQ3VG47_9CHLR|nr:dihydrolipoamide acetyltransferase family protein [Dictyobacter formicarum]GHO85130.1 dihydrolipoamide acetyltransferase component of pyruvate dehydrogenase complex [Dictyobacter formicarum]